MRKSNLRAPIRILRAQIQKALDDLARREKWKWIDVGAVILSILVSVGPVVARIAGLIISSSDHTVL